MATHFYNHSNSAELFGTSEPKLDNREMLTSYVSHESSDVSVRGALTGELHIGRDLFPGERHE